MIRRATFADVPGLRRLYAALTLELEGRRPVAYPLHGPEDLDRFTLLTVQRIDEPTLLLYVATDDAGELVGFLGGEVSERAMGEPRIFGSAHWLYIVPAWRGRGVARALVRSAVADLEALGVTHVELATYEGDPQWRARGWVPYLVHHALPLAAVLAGVVERPAVEPTPTAPAAPAPPPVEAPAAPPKRRRGRPPKPRLVAGGRA
jgi:ribosomal protein S18 acetylase RimI-like enzyme